jgi:hypothetical protein
MTGPARERAIDALTRHVRFCTADPVRFQLLFQRTIPGFEPSAESYAVAVRAFETITEQLASIGVTDPSAVDLWTAFGSGLASQQIANDPGGRRWIDLIGRAVDVLLQDPHTHPTA